eukprot:scaffold739_cov166-Pinguiococcus_pyrenoidosus.AAC.5
MSRIRGSMTISEKCEAAERNPYGAVARFRIVKRSFSSASLSSKVGLDSRILVVPRILKGVL